MPMLRHFPERAKAICRAGLTREATVGELSVMLARKIAADGMPGLLVVDPSREQSHDFRVWRGAQTMVDGLRMLMRAGIWPGPADIPSVERLITERFNRNAFATILWGEGAKDEGPWAPLWRERDIRHGLYTVARGRCGDIVVGLFGRRASAPPFTARDLAYAEAIVPYFASALDTDSTPPDAANRLLSSEATVGFSATGKIETFGQNALETLSYAGGGTENAVATARNIVEAAVATVHLPDRHVTPTNTPEADFDNSYFKVWPNPGRTKEHIVRVADTPFGRIDLRVSFAVDTGGGIRALGTLRHSISRRLAVVRALVDSDIPSREFDLALALEADLSLPRAAESLGLGIETVKTLDRRLRARFDVANREALLARMAEAGAKSLR